jgi:hypothetical protein
VKGKAILISNHPWGTGGGIVARQGLRGQDTEFARKWTGLCRSCEDCHRHGGENQYCLEIVSFSHDLFLLNNKARKLRIKSTRPSPFCSDRLLIVQAKPPTYQITSPPP